MKNIFILLALISSSLLFTGCVNKELELASLESLLIEEESELFLFLTQVTESESSPTSVTCIDFVYGFRVFVYDDSDTYVNAEFVSGDLDFYNLLTGIPEGYSVGISFPISATLDDGSEFIIEDRAQLGQAILSCVTQIQDATLSSATENFSNPECGWVVKTPEETDSTEWENSVFEVSDTGLLVFYDQGIGSAGTWIFYYIANQLHLNIFLDSTNETITDTWNKDWAVTLINEESMLLTNEDMEFTLAKKCRPEEQYCTTLLFKECETVDSSGIAIFNFMDYSFCIGIITNQPLEDGYTFAYFLTLEDANTNTNELLQTGYQNEVNPQTIYVRVTNPHDDSWSITEITIYAEPCD